MPPIVAASYDLNRGAVLPALIVVDAGSGTATILTTATSPAATENPLYTIYRQRPSGLEVLRSDLTPGFETGAGQTRRAWPLLDAWNVMDEPGAVYFLFLTGEYRITGESFNRRFAEWIRLQILRTGVE